MSARSLKFSRVPGTFAVCRLPAASPVPAWALHGDFFSATSTSDELSIVCPTAHVPDGTQHESGWACFKLIGPFPFAETGILSSFLQPLAASAVPIFAISTFDTDYVLVKEADVEKALAALRDAGHTAV